MKIFIPYEQTNPKAHRESPYALRHAAGRPTGRYDTVAGAFDAAEPGATIVTAEGWWIIASVTDTVDEGLMACWNGHYFTKHLRHYADVYCPVCGTKEIGRCEEGS